MLLFPLPAYKENGDEFGDEADMPTGCSYEHLCPEARVNVVDVRDARMRGRGSQFGSLVASLAQGVLPWSDGNYINVLAKHQIGMYYFPSFSCYYHRSV